jgi:hypothetical protein
MVEEYIGSGLRSLVAKIVTKAFILHFFRTMGDGIMINMGYETFAMLSWMRMLDKTRKRAI